LDGPITNYSWAEGIALMTVFMMFFIELMASRFDIFGEQDLEAADPAMDLIRKRSAVGDKASDQEAPYQDSKSNVLPRLSYAGFHHTLGDSAFGQAFCKTNQTLAN